MSVAWILVYFDVIKGLFNSIELTFQDKVNT
jgi:hypothetical protein